MRLEAIKLRNSVENIQGINGLPGLLWQEFAKSVMPESIWSLVNNI